MDDSISHLVRLCADSGYYPKTWRMAIAVALQKPNCDYSLPRLYQLIQLLEVLGKALERVQACRLAYIAAKHHLFPMTQYGRIPGRSAQDALMSIVHDVEAAWNHKRVVTMLTFDITGFFNNIPHSHLIDMLRKMNIPLPIMKWVLSFLQEWKAAICLDGQQDQLRPISTGVPQGSCISPILAAYLTAPMARAIDVEVHAHIAADTELSTLARKGQIKLCPLTLYVDNGSIAASAPSWGEATRIVI
jgi:hypothetical protein